MFYHSKLKIKTMSISKQDLAVIFVLMFMFLGRMVWASQSLKSIICAWLFFPFYYIWYKNVLLFSASGAFGQHSLIQNDLHPLVLLSLLKFASSEHLFTFTFPFFVLKRRAYCLLIVHHLFRTFIFLPPHMPKFWHHVFFSNGFVCSWSTFLGLVGSMSWICMAWVNLRPEQQFFVDWGLCN